MYTLISIFYISVLGIVLMLILKGREVKTGTPSFLSQIGRGTDHIFQRFFTAIKKVFAYVNRHTFIALAQWVAYHILLRVRNLYVEIKHKFISNPHGKKLIDAVRGRGQIRDHGASIYLRRISDR